jgi:hypothetical protein
MDKTTNARTWVRFMVFASLLWSASSQAVQVQIDQAGIGGFVDSFSNNLTPSQESFYSVFGSFPNGAESGGLLTLNSDWGGLSPNAAGAARRTLSTLGLTGPTDLTKSSDLLIYGIFTAVAPVGPMTNGYGIRVKDAGLGTTTLMAEVSVEYLASTGNTEIRFYLQDFVNGTITTLGQVPLVIPTSADEIALGLMHSGNSSDFTGLYAFGTNGVLGNITSFAATAPMFDGTNWVRAGFDAFSAVPVPEPETYAMLLAGLGLLGWFGRGRKQNLA